MRTTVQDIQAYKTRGERFAMVTAYDYTAARLASAAGLPLLLVGDSLGMVVQGRDTTIPVTLDDIVYHTRLVTRGAGDAFVVADMPFMTYPDVAEGVRNAGRLFQGSGAQAVKLEGGGHVAEIVAAIVARGIPVMGHLGYTPQSVHRFGKQIVRGKAIAEAKQLLADAHALEDAGAFAVVLECVPAALAAKITHELRIPTIGIGSGADCDGEVQVWHDVLGLSPDFVPRHAKLYARLAETITDALRTYAAEVRDRRFPTERHASQLPEETQRALIQEVEATGTE